VVFVADFVGPPQESREFAVVGAKIGEHFVRREGFFVIVFETLVPGNIADGTERCGAELAGTLGDVVGHGEDLIGVLVEQEMVIAKISAGHVPMEIFCFHVEGKRVGEQMTEFGRYFRNAIAREIGG
jgi:hypothetical protein